MLIGIGMVIEILNDGMMANISLKNARYQQKIKSFPYSIVSSIRMGSHHYLCAREIVLQTQDFVYLVRI